MSTLTFDLRLWEYHMLVFLRFSVQHHITEGMFVPVGTFPAQIAAVTFLVLTMNPHLLFIKFTLPIFTHLHILRYGLLFHFLIWLLRIVCLWLIRSVVIITCVTKVILV